MTEKQLADTSNAKRLALQKAIDSGYETTSSSMSGRVATPDLTIVAAQN